MKNSTTLLYLFLTISIFLIGVVSFCYIHFVLMFDIYNIFITYISFAIIIYFLERKFLGSKTFFILFWSINMMIILSLYRFEFRNIKNSELTNQKDTIDKVFFISSNINEKVRYLKLQGYTKAEVAHKLRNDIKFKELIKNGLEDFNSIYDSK